MYAQMVLDTTSDDVLESNSSARELKPYEEFLASMRLQENAMIEEVEPDALDLLNPGEEHQECPSSEEEGEGDGGYEEGDAYMSMLWVRVDRL